MLGRSNRGRRFLKEQLQTLHIPWDVMALTEFHIEIFQWHDVSVFEVLQTFTDGQELLISRFKRFTQHVLDRDS
jgi:hypothetical protein